MVSISGHDGQLGTLKTRTCACLCHSTRFHVDNLLLTGRNAQLENYWRYIKPFCLTCHPIFHAMWDVAGVMYTGSYYILPRNPFNSFTLPGKDKNRSCKPKYEPEIVVMHKLQQRSVQCIPFLGRKYFCIKGIILN